MSPFVVTLVMTAALLHAIWNSLVKAAGDRAAMLGLISLGHVTLGVALALNVAPPSVESWPYIFASTLIHFGYYFLLNWSYRLGDLSLVYPIARGIAPVLVALGAQATADEILPLHVWLGIGCVSLGILFLSRTAFIGKAPLAMVLAALATGVAIAGYSLVDGLGVRVSGSPLGYIAWLFIAEITIVGFVAQRRGRLLFALPRRAVFTGLAGGVIAALAYGLVVYAKFLAPLGIVSALRETSVLFAAMIGIFVLGERPWRMRMLAVVFVATGVVLIL